MTFPIKLLKQKIRNNLVFLNRISTNRSKVQIFNCFWKKNSSKQWELIGYVTFLTIVPCAIKNLNKAGRVVSLRRNIRSYNKDQ